jgi:hypothetical protein
MGAMGVPQVSHLRGEGGAGCDDLRRGRWWLQTFQGSAAQESTRYELVDTQQRIAQLTPIALSNNITSKYGWVCIQLHSGLWDLYGLSGCRASPRLLSSGDYPREWQAAAWRSLVQPMHAAIAEGAAFHLSAICRQLRCLCIGGSTVFAW